MGASAAPQQANRAARPSFRPGMPQPGILVKNATVHGRGGWRTWLIQIAGRTGTNLVERLR